MWFRPARFLATGLALLGCGHGDPFAVRPVGSDSTLSGAVDRRLTFNLGTDITPAWREDGSTIIYAFEDLAHPGRDLCLAELLPTGGSQRGVMCPAGSSSDSADQLFEPAVSADGRLLYLREVALEPGEIPISATLLETTDGQQLPSTPLLSYPYTAPDGRLHQGISNLRWAGPGHAVYVAQKVERLAPCARCPEEIVRTGIGLVVLDLSAIPPALRVVPNTEDISSVTVSAGGHAVYFTRNNERWIYQLVLANSAYRTAYGFPPGEIARDVQVAGRRLVAVVGGKVSYQDDPVLGPLQRDHGGRLWVVDLETGAANVLVVEGRFFRRPALSPDGTRLVAEAYETTITSRPESLGGGADTVVGNVADLWLFDLP